MNKAHLSGQSETVSTINPFYSSGIFFPRRLDTILLLHPTDLAEPPMGHK